MSKTLTSIDKMNSLNLDRSEWKLVSFGDVAQKQNESVDRETTKLKRYIGGEHMGSEDLHLRQWGDVGENYLGPAFTRKFSIGDILYGSRRTYLRKVAVADFEGITANTTFVIKANEDVIVKELLPFVMLSEGFTQHSIRNSKGSVNPYINWKDIANYEFLLPPKDQQAKLAELLWAADALIDSQEMADQSLELLKSARIKELLWDEYDPVAKTYTESRASWKLAKLSEKCDLITKGTTPTTAGYSFTSSGVKFFKIESFDKDGNLVPEGTKYISEAAHEALARSQIKEGDILFSIAGALGRAALVNSTMIPGNTNQALCVIRPNIDQLLSEFLIQILRSDYIQNLIARINVKAAQANISLTNVRDFVIPIPPLNAQLEVISQISIIENSVKEAASNNGHSKNLFKSLINQIF